MQRSLLILFFKYVVGTNIKGNYIKLLNISVDKSGKFVTGQIIKIFEEYEVGKKLIYRQYDKAPVIYERCKGVQTYIKTSKCLFYLLFSTLTEFNSNTKKRRVCAHVCFIRFCKLVSKKNLALHQAGYNIKRLYKQKQPVIWPAQVYV